MSKYNEWEETITEIIEDRLFCTRSDAQGIVEANYFILAQSWSKDLTAEEAADKILSQ